MKNCCLCNHCLQIPCYLLEDYKKMGVDSDTGNYCLLKNKTIHALNTACKKFNENIENSLDIKEML